MSIKYADIKELRELGYIQEVNRQFFHPLGLALEVTVDDEGNYKLGGIWDYRDDPEGMLFAESATSKESWEEKAQNIADALREKADVRLKKYGFVIQPTLLDEVN